MGQHVTVRERVESDLIVLHQRLRRVGLDRRRQQPTASEAGRREGLDALHTATRAEIASYENALQRIVDGSYGRCQGCGKQIDRARLDSVPHASVCVSCTS